MIMTAAARRVERCRVVNQPRRGVDPLLPIRLAVGDEELLVSRAAAEVVDAARRADAYVDVREHDAAGFLAPELFELLSPSLFGERRVLVVRDVQVASKDLAAALLDYAAAPTEQVCLVLTHTGANRNRPLLDALVKAGAARIDCAKVTKYGDRLRFVTGEVRRRGGTIDDDAAQTLLDAVGNDLRELAAACDQLASDYPGRIDTDVVGRYHRGRAEVTGFTVADHVMVGDVSRALEALRWALSLGVDPVPIADALADGVRSVSRVLAAGGGNAASLAGALKMPPWKIDRARRQGRGWSAAGLHAAMIVAAKANADVKGGAADTAYAVERAVLSLSAARTL